MKAFSIILTRTTTEECEIDIDAETLEEAKDAAIAEADADDEGGQNFDWIISTGTEYEARNADSDAEDDCKPVTRVSKIERLITAGDYEAGPGAVCDILADLRHYCDVHGIDFAHQDKAAYQHYQEEAREARQP